MGFFYAVKSLLRWIAQTRFLVLCFVAGYYLRVFLQFIIWLLWAALVVGVHVLLVFAEVDLELGLLPRILNIALIPLSLYLITLWLYVSYWVAFVRGKEPLSLYLWRRVPQLFILLRRNRNPAENTHNPNSATEEQRTKSLSPTGTTVSPKQSKQVPKDFRWKSCWYNHLSANSAAVYR